jgi:hypothetical protein
MNPEVDMPLEALREPSEPAPADRYESRPEAFPEGIVRPIAFETPLRLTDINSWHGHIPFAFWIIEALRSSIHNFW